MPRWHFPWWDGWRCMWLKKLQEWKNDDETEAECLDYTSPENVEECVSDINDDKNEKNYRENEAEFMDENFPD